MTFLCRCAVKKPINQNHPILTKFCTEAHIMMFLLKNINRKFTQTKQNGGGGHLGFSNKYCSFAKNRPIFLGNSKHRFVATIPIE